MQHHQLPKIFEPLSGPTSKIPHNDSSATSSDSPALRSDHADSHPVFQIYELRTNLIAMASRGPRERQNLAHMRVLSNPGNFEWFLSLKREHLEKKEMKLRELNQQLEVCEQIAEVVMMSLEEGVAAVESGGWKYSDMLEQRTRDVTVLGQDIEDSLQALRGCNEELEELRSDVEVLEKLMATMCVAERAWV